MGNDGILTELRRDVREFVVSFNLGGWAEGACAGRSIAFEAGRLGIVG